MQWRKVVVILLGLALMASFGLGAVATSWQQRPSTADLLAGYDQQAISYWVSGSSASPAVARALKPSRDGFVTKGVTIEQADSRTIAVSETEDDGQLEVRATVNTGWVLRQDSSGQRESSTSTDAHRLVFDLDSGELVSDEFLQE
ncbi:MULTISPECIES: hypothetical protein [unclassified Luteococcus]|uniref:hypothetical protein n=1 Tax=unclassified Luteococcus TaxID=2639923 RepID=UPI00313E7725